MSFSSPPGSAFSCWRFFTPSPATACEARAMTFDYSLAALVTLGILFYLVYALVRPEQF
jgi:K+-transporting ATPase KdpF subunit